MIDFPENVASWRSADRSDLEELYSPESPPLEMDRELLEMVEFLETNLPSELSNSSDVENDSSENNSNESPNVLSTTEPNDERFCFLETFSENEDSHPEVDSSQKIDDSTRKTAVTTNFFRDDLIARVRRLSNSRIDALYDNIVYHSDFNRYNNSRK